MIGTKLHTAVEIAGGAGQEFALFERMMAAPKFCISPEVVLMIGREDVQRAIMSVLEAGIGRLPYNPLLVEFSLPGTARYFVRLVETEIEHVLDAELAWLSEDTEKQVVTVVERPIPIRIEESGLRVQYLAENPHTDDPAPWAVAAATLFAILMLNTRGIEKRVIETAKINKARAKCGDGRPPIPHHSIVHIGTIYDKSGRAHSATGSGRHMPVHMRAGHARTQHYGKGNELTKMVFIPPTLVNYRESGDQKPRLPDKVVAV